MSLLVRPIVFTLVLMMFFPIFIGKGLAQRDPGLISSRNYVGIEAGLNYTWLPGSTNYYFGFDWPFQSDPNQTVVQKITLINPGSGIGYQFGGTLDLSFTDFLGLQFKLQYRQHSTSSTETETVPPDSLDVNPGTADLQKTFKTSLGMLGIDALLRLQFVKESFYGLVGLGFSDVLSDGVAIHETILSSTNNSEFLYLPSGQGTGLTEFDIPSTKTNSYFNSTEFHAKLGVGTYIPIGSNGWVLTPELILAIPLTSWESKTFSDEYAANGVTPPKMWYATLSIALKFPFGAMSKAEAAAEEKETPEKESQKYADLKGKVTDAKTGKPVQADVTVTDLGNNSVVTKTKTEPDGSYDVKVKAPGKYSVTADADNYLFGSAYFDVDPEGRILRGDHDIKLSEASGKTRLLVFFDYGKDELQRSSYPELERIVQLMRANPKMKVEIAGYTDSKGSPEYNLDLSKRRAESVKTYLVRQGISDSRITTKGYGEANPIASNDTDEGRAENRRVEFVVLSR
ncbi:MAG: OmpA family protein [Bacteroidota bacterium]|nr:OmpA family protein [Bacteroidota bacterium]